MHVINTLHDIFFTNSWYIRKDNYNLTLWGKVIETLWLIEMYVVINNQAFSSYLFAGKVTLWLKKYMCIYISNSNVFNALKNQKVMIISLFYILVYLIAYILKISIWHLSLLKFLPYGRTHCFFFWLRFKSKWCG